MPHRHIEENVLYHIERGPSRELLFDCARLGDLSGFFIRFTIRGDFEDFVGERDASVEGIHRVGKSSRHMFFLMGRLTDDANHPKCPLWVRPFYFAQYNLKTYRGRIEFGQESFLTSPLKRFGPYRESEGSL